MDTFTAAQRSMVMMPTPSRGRRMPMPALLPSDRPKSGIRAREMNAPRVKTSP
jgi:hypothetical protein